MFCNPSEGLAKEIEEVLNRDDLTNNGVIGAANSDIQQKN